MPTQACRSGGLTADRHCRSSRRAGYTLIVNHELPVDLAGQTYGQPRRRADADAEHHRQDPSALPEDIKRSGLGVHLFESARFDKDGKEKPDFILNQEILPRRSSRTSGFVARDAPWALLDFGIRCIIAPDFADIFFNNSFILPIRRAASVCDQLIEDSKLGGNARVTIDLCPPGGDTTEWRGNPLRHRSISEAFAAEWTGRHQTKHATAIAPAREPSGVLLTTV